MDVKADTYRTIEKPSNGLFKDRGSKFIAFAYPVENEIVCKEKIAHIKKEYFDARHHCFAYAMGANREHFRTFDAGEPSGTAGKPIFGQICSFQLTNVLIIVVRYFGGTLLGTSGLINAYKNAAADALNTAVIVEKTMKHVFELRFDYLVMNEVMKVLKDEDVGILSQHFDNVCTFEIAVRQSASNMFENKLKVLQTVTLILKNETS